jgi:hypothetical protein
MEEKERGPKISRNKNVEEGYDSFSVFLMPLIPVILRRSFLFLLAHTIHG